MAEALTLTKNDLKEIVSAAVAASQASVVEAIRELRKPSELEQARIDAETRDMKAKNDERLTNAASVRATMETKRAIHRACTHEHPNGDSHCTWVQEKAGPGYLICQKNQCIIRPGQPPANYNGDDIYDSPMFSRIFQKLNTSGADIIG